MAAYREEEIPLTQIELDADNPRHEKLESQVEVFEWMLTGRGKIGGKVLALAKDIVGHGLNPAERIMVVEREDRPATYVAIEGNRRIAALKLLNNPDVAPTAEWKRRFSEAVRQGYAPVQTVPCVVFRTREDADHFVELKHLGEAGGAGVVPWDAIQKARHEQQTGRSRNTDALEILTFVQERPDLFDEKTRQAASDVGFPITTLQRLLSDRDFRAFLGFGKDRSGQIVFETEPREVAKALRRIIEDFGGGDKRKTVAAVINKAKRTEYMRGFDRSQQPDHSKKLRQPVTVTSEAATRMGATEEGPPTRVSKRRYVDPKGRCAVVIRGFNIPIDPGQFNRASRLYDELKEIPLRTSSGTPLFPNASILLVRTFLEISVDTYILKHSMQSPNPKGWDGISLAEKIKLVLKHLRARSAMSDQEAKVITKVLGDPNKAANPNSINDMIHNLNQLPIPADVIDIWDTYSRFLQQLWGQM